MQISPNIWLGRCLEPQNSSRHSGTSRVTTSAFWHSIKIRKRCLVDDRLQNHRRCVLQPHGRKNAKIHFPFWRLQKLKRKPSLASKFLLIDTKSHWLSSNFCRLLAKRSWVCLCAFHRRALLRFHDSEQIQSMCPHDYVVLKIRKKRILQNLCGLAQFILKHLETI